MRLLIFPSCFTPNNPSWLNVHCAQHRDRGVINSHWIHFLRTLMARTEVINCKTEHVVNSVWFLVLKDRFAARHVSYTRYFTNRFPERSSFTLWIPLAQVQVCSEPPNWLLTSSSAEVCLQDGDVVTTHSQGSRTCLTWSKRAAVLMQPLYGNGQLTATLSSFICSCFLFPSIRAHLCLWIKFWLGCDSENHS